MARSYFGNPGPERSSHSGLRPDSNRDQAVPPDVSRGLLALLASEFPAGSVTVLLDRFDILSSTIIDDSPQGTVGIAW